MTDDLEDLREQTEQGDRITEDSQTEGRRDAIKREMSGLDSPTLSFRDRNLRALLVALDERDELEAVADALAGATDRAVPEGPTPSDVLALAVRAGLAGEAPDALEDMADAAAEFEREQA